MTVLSPFNFRGSDRRKQYPLPLERVGGPHQPIPS
eukprot:COSAG02_NODE_68258_length_251_cov_0.657895_1_plen_34_part_10